MRDLSLRAKLTKLLRENIREKACDPGSGSTFLDMPPKAQAMVHGTTPKLEASVHQGHKEQGAKAAVGESV